MIKRFESTRQKQLERSADQWFGGLTNCSRTHLQFSARCLALPKDEGRQKAQCLNQVLAGENGKVRVMIQKKIFR